MTARITKFYSRAELGMRKPKGVSFYITPQNGGCTVHYGGGGPNPAPTTFAAAKRIWLGWQDFHMDGQGWKDIAYTAGYDNLGNVYAGRGLGVRSGAQGSDFGNQNYYAFVWIGGGTAVPSEKAVDALEWLIYWARTNGDAGMRVRPHSDFTSTSCPGKGLKNEIPYLDNKKIILPGSKPLPTPPKYKDDDMPRLVQVDGKAPQYLTTGAEIFWLKDGKAKANAVRVFSLDPDPVIVPSLAGLGVLVGTDPNAK